MVQRSRSLVVCWVIATAWFAGAAFWAEPTVAESVRPNVLLIVCDDLSDAVAGYDVRPQAVTPNLGKLAKSSVVFRNAHCSSPVCGPSRASLFTGVYPHRSGLYGHLQNAYTWRQSPVLADAVTVFEHFADSGYEVLAAGKVFHNNQHVGSLFARIGGPGAFGVDHTFGPFPWDGRASSPFDTAHPHLRAPWADGFIDGFKTFAALSAVPDVPPNEATGAPGYRGWRESGAPFRYESAEDRDLMCDEECAQWAAERLKEPRERPFFLTVGFTRPHVPLVAPEEFFDLYEAEKIELPECRADDLKDCGPLALGGETAAIFRLEALREGHGGDAGWREWLRAYLACVSFVDHQIGVVLDALEASGQSENTIVIVTSDHGFHIGEKGWLQKNTLWEESTRVPLFVFAPGLPGGGEGCDTPVSLIDVYPTLVDLCGLPENPNQDRAAGQLDGHSLRPLLEAPSRGEWAGPPAALTVVRGPENPEIGEVAPVGRQHRTVRGPRYRYSLYSDGFEELYDHEHDPNEFDNLAWSKPNDSAVQESITRLRSIMEDLTGP